MEHSWEAWPKHFLYLSPIKIDAIYGQIEPNLLKKIAKKLTIDLKVLKAEFSEAERSDTIYSRLKVVVEYLADKRMIGTADSPRQYFADSMMMSWGPYGVGRHEGTTSVIFFGGHTASTTLGLGGSIQNMFGGREETPIHSHSATPALLHALSKELEEVDEMPLPSNDAMADPEWALGAVALAVRQFEGPSQRIEFVAKRLLNGEAFEDSSAPAILLGTPLYAALVD